ncbi:MAG: polysaccharide biosynthesis protein, partial [Actinomycetota bacterium]|nr:polysaccharide biosynthesis protein [Actinomycetota bacterium]
FQSRLISFRRTREEVSGLRVVVIGGRDAGAALIGEMLRHPQMGFRPVAVLDPDPRLHGRSVMGLVVRGDIARLPEVAKAADAHQAVLAMSSVTTEVVQSASRAAEAAGISLKIVPDMQRRISAGISLRDMRDVNIDDLLGRTEVVTDLDAVRQLLHGRRVLITGAGGSIGSEIARQVAGCEPAALLLLDHDETHLHDVAGTIATPVVQVLADVRSRDRMQRVFREHRPEIVFHAAAHKHVPLLEAHPCEAVATNVVGTQNVLEACRESGVSRLVFISTDKAVEPSSVMGASKRIGEQLVLTSAPEDARWCSVRFGNVLGSRGSVIPTFMRQIATGGPVTVTDRRMTRYFMSIEEAVQLVLQAMVLATGGDVFVLDMGQPVRIYDLAERMIRLSGRRVGADIEILVTGTRPGEKLNEELHTEAEALMPTLHPSISRLDAQPVDVAVLSTGADRLHRLALHARDDEVRDLLFSLVSAPPETNPVALDQSR